MKGRRSERFVGPANRCDIKTWSGSCEHGDYKREGDKYLCKVCETIPTLDHQVNHVGYPHVSGDYDNLY